MLALRTDVHVWRSDFQRGLDAHLEACGVTLLDLPWSAFELLPDDRDHFTWRGFLAFAAHLVSVLDAHVQPDERPVRIYADSAIDYWNWDHEGNYTGKADAALARAMRLRANLTSKRVGRPARLAPELLVDAVNGSGFVALADEARDFRSRRLRAERDDARGVTTLVVGGWNDRHWPLAEVRTRVDAFLRPVRRRA